MLLFPNLFSPTMSPHGDPASAIEATEDNGGRGIGSGGGGGGVVTVGGRATLPTLYVQDETASGPDSASGSSSSSGRDPGALRFRNRSDEGGNGGKGGGRKGPKYGEMMSETPTQNNPVFMSCSLCPGTPSTTTVSSPDSGIDASSPCSAAADDSISSADYGSPDSTLDGSYISAAPIPLPPPPPMPQAAPGSLYSYGDQTPPVLYVCVKNFLLF